MLDLYPESLPALIRRGRLGNSGREGNPVGSTPGHTHMWCRSLGFSRPGPGGDHGTGLGSSPCCSLGPQNNCNFRNLWGASSFDRGLNTLQDLGYLLRHGRGHTSTLCLLNPWGLMGGNLWGHVGNFKPWTWICWRGGHPGGKGIPGI